MGEQPGHPPSPEQSFVGLSINQHSSLILEFFKTRFLGLDRKSNFSSYASLNPSDTSWPVLYQTFASEPIKESLSWVYHTLLPRFLPIIGQKAIERNIFDFLFCPTRPYPSLGLFSDANLPLSPFCVLSNQTLRVEISLPIYHKSQPT